MTVIQIVILLHALSPATGGADRFQSISRANTIDVEISRNLPAITSFYDVAAREYKNLRVEIIKLIAKKSTVADSLPS